MYLSYECSTLDFQQIPPLGSRMCVSDVGVWVLSDEWRGFFEVSQVPEGRQCGTQNFFERNFVYLSGWDSKL